MANFEGEGKEEKAAVGEGMPGAACERLRTKAAMAFPSLAGGRREALLIPKPDPHRGTLSPEIQAKAGPPEEESPQEQMSLPLRNRQHVPLPLLNNHWTVSPGAPSLTYAFRGPGLPHSEPPYLQLGGGRFCQEGQGLWASFSDLGLKSSSGALASATNPMGPLHVYVKRGMPF